MIGVVCTRRSAMALAIVLLFAACNTRPLHTSPLQLARESAFVAVTVHDCYDGDTCTVTLHDLALPAVFAERLPVRLAGIDTPEIRGRCPEEIRRAYLAREFLRARLARAVRIDLLNPERDKYFRLRANLSADGEDVSQSLLAAGLARPYTGSARTSWC